MCFSVSVNPLLTVLNTASNRNGIKNRHPVSFGTWGALTGCHTGVRIFVVCVSGSSINASVLAVIIIITIVVVVVVVVVVVLDTREPVAVVLDGVAEPQLLQLLPQLVPLLLLLLLPGKTTF